MDAGAGLEPTAVRVVAAGRESSAPSAAPRRLVAARRARSPPSRRAGATTASPWSSGSRVPTTAPRGWFVRLPSPARGLSGFRRSRYASAQMSVDLTLDRHGRGHTWLVYELDREAAAGSRSRRRRLNPRRPASALWSGRSFLAFHEPLLDHLFDAARWQLPAAISSGGRLDGSIWQYNREWVRDQAVIALALTQLGHRALAATMLTRLLTDFVTPEGATLDSSEVRGRDDVELDQNGILLYALEQYTVLDRRSSRSWRRTGHACGPWRTIPCAPSSGTRRAACCRAAASTGNGTPRTASSPGSNWCTRRSCRSACRARRPSPVSSDIRMPNSGGSGPRTRCARRGWSTRCSGCRTSAGSSNAARSTAASRNRSSRTPTRACRTASR